MDAPDLDLSASVWCSHPVVIGSPVQQEPLREMQIQIAGGKVAMLLVWEGGRACLFVREDDDVPLRGD